MWHSLISIFRNIDYVISFEIYMDESGREDDKNTPITTVAGAYAKCMRWQSIESQWNSVLKKFGVDIFHAADLANFQGEFKKKEGWNEDRRDRLLDKLNGVIVNEHLKLFGIAVDNHIFQEIKAEFPKVKRDAYQFCCEGTIFTLLRRLEKKQETVQSIGFVFDWGRKFTTPMMNLLDDIAENRRKNNINPRITIARGNKKDFIPLQVADQIAYEFYRLQKDYQYSSVTQLRPSIRLLKRRISRT